ncbi:MAG: DEAD/DEAH box helicase [Gemmatimonadota bacterium]|jgi:ATP-dependent RNA helicase DeaD|nr:DEAD/DEAH box helicase [Gemmatimonadota bacterium]
MAVRKTKAGDQAEEGSESVDGKAIEGFAALGLQPQLVDTLSQLGYEEPTPIQREAIPPILEGRDLVGMAATGTGKTAAFSLPVIERLASLRGKSRPVALILVPTRELAMQVSEAVHRYGRALNVSVLPIYGGQSFAQQFRVLSRGVDVVVATPGRALDHINRGTLDLRGVGMVVLDEADEMLDMGFAEDLEAILAETPEGRQTVLFSATMPPRIASIARQHLTNPVQIRIEREQVAAGEMPRVRQTAYIVPRAHKLTALARVLDMEAPEAALVFCRTRNEVDELTEKLNAHGHRAEAIHGGMSQEQRDRVMKKLRGGQAELLVATDVAARGLDISHLTHVINYDVPSAPESYVHRIGRVGRAGREGVAITLAEPREHRLLRSIEYLTKRKLEIGRVPTIADLRTRKLELLRASLRETLLAGDADRYRVVVESLSDEFDAVEIAIAAVRMAHEAMGGDVDDGEDLPDASAWAERPSRERGTGAPGGKDRKRPAGRDGDERGPRRGAGARESLAGSTRIFIGAGREAGVRPGDLVGAITGESGISGREIGAIEINDRFSIVEIADDVANQVLESLRGGKIKGKKVIIRRDRGPVR